MNTSELWIGGKDHKPSSGEYFDDLNPSNADLIARVAKGNSADISTAVADAKKTFQHFKNSEVRERAARTSALVRAEDGVTIAADFIDSIVESHKYPWPTPGSGAST